MSTVANKLIGIIQARLAANSLDLPAPPEAATACLGMLQNPDVDTADLVRVLKRDPLLVAQLLRVGNAAAYSGGARIVSVEQAITRLGHKNLKAVVLEASTRKLFNSRDPRIATIVNSMFVHALAVATLGRDVASVAGCKDVETVYLTGLLHDVGKIIIASFLLEAERSLVGAHKGWLDPKTWRTIVQEGHRPIGLALAEKWAFPDAVIGALGTCTDYDAGRPNAAGNFVCFANAVAKVQGIYEGDVDALDNAATVMLGRSVLRLDDEIMDRLAADLQARVTALV